MTILGIRHHGPGSAKAALKALEANPPDCLLIEFPADGEGLLEYLSPKPKVQSQSEVENLEFRGEIETEDDASPSTVSEAAVLRPSSLVPPVSALIYNPKDITQASYLPFAEFSPEWQAMLFAVERDIPVRFMDLPMSMNFFLNEKEKGDEQSEMDFFKKLSPEEREFRQDPMAHLARLAGYSDSERWWEVTFESAENELEIFDAIRQMNEALREDAVETPRTLQREAFMRKTIRQAEKDGFQNIAVICGAWHVPALSDLKKHKVSHDAKLLKGIKKTKTVATWIPWSYDRLTFGSGYRAGVNSPAWYELIFSEKKEAATRWMVNVARLFREEDMDASSAHVIEAIRLAETLAAMRGLQVPGIDELREAAVTTICEGSDDKLKLIEERLITGSKVGSVPDNVPTVPLQKDIERSVKSARLSKYWEAPEEHWLGEMKAKPQGGIDLREESGRMKSHLLHRLNILEIPWGHLVELDRHRSAGGFSEFWKMKWQPDFAIRIIEMGAWGTTVEEACLNFLQKKIAETTALPALTTLVKLTLDADLPTAFGALLKKLEDLAALTTDVFHHMEALPPLVSIVRYGNTRGTDVSTVEKVVINLVPRICIGLPGALSNLDEDESRSALQKLQNVNRSLGQLNEPDFNRQWNSTLRNIADNAQINGLLNGACTRILFDKKIVTENETATRMHYALSRASAPLMAAQWLEGFLDGSGLILIHNHQLWNLLDEWVSELNPDHFSDVLALLRRSFSRFSEAERERMMNLAKKGQMEIMEKENGEEMNERGRVVLGTVKKLLGI